MIAMDGFKVLNKINKKEEIQVYRAIRLVDNFPVILKYISDFQDSNRLINEQELLQYFNNQSIIKSYGLIPCSNSIALILEDGGDSLKDYFIQKKSLPVEEFLTIALELSNILSIVHKKNIIHKDIKPANFVIKKDTSGKLLIKLIDFGISTKLKREEMGWKSLEVLEGSLPYISPEQTGRINRAIDYRTDFYSLGVTFYELLTGRLPFINKEPIELVHSHIAKKPPDILDLKDGIPESLSLIIKKLMDKNPENRYHSTKGLIYDLENIYSTNFLLGSKDYSDIFSIPQKLYGREKEIERLLSLFDTVAGGISSTGANIHASILLVSGYSGVGKTSFVNETHKSITEKNGYFIKGKFDQFQRNIPFSAVVQAFRGLINQILTESKENLNGWKAQIQFAMGTNGQIMVDVIPELEHIIGKQNPVHELGSVETQNRFNLTFQNFISIFTKKKHPVVLFIDDLQWADIPSLNLIKLLMTDSDSKYLMIIGTFRDNEVDSTHPLTNTIENIKKSGIEINTIHLSPLEKSHIVELVSDTLCTKENVQSFVELLNTKTGGNPFFLSEFLKTLYKEKIIYFDYETNSWKWYEDKIFSYGVTENIVELMVRNLKKLSQETTHILSLASCMGNSFDINILSLISELSVSSVSKSLAPALEEGFLILENNTIRFQHDRVQQAAYTFIDEKKKKENHLKIGRLLLANTKEEELEEKLFDIVNQYNQGVELITKNIEKLKLVELNLKAGKKAKNSTFYNSAIQYFEIGRKLLNRKYDWKKNYQLLFEFTKEIGECEGIIGNFETSDKLFKLAFNKAKNKVDKAKIYIRQIVLFSAQGKYKDAVQISIQALRLFRFYIPDFEQKEKIQQEMDTEIKKFLKLMKDREVMSLFELPVIQKERQKLISEIVGITSDSLVIGVPGLLGLFVFKMANLSILNGLAPFDPFIFGVVSIILTNEFKDYKRALQFTILAEKINQEKIFNSSINAKVNHLLAYYSPLNNPIIKSIQLHKKTFQLGLEFGDMIYCAYSIHNIFEYTFEISINEAMIELESMLPFYKKIKHLFASLVLFYIGLLSNLQGHIKDNKLTIYRELTEEEFLLIFKETLAVVGIYKKYKLVFFTLFEEFEDALPFVLERETWINIYSFDLFYRCEYYYFSALVVFSLYSSQNEEDKKKYIKIFSECINEIRLLCEVYQNNFYHYYLALQAEKARIEKKVIEAVSLYEEAIQQAKENGFLRNEALCNELCAKFWIENGNKKIASLYITESHRLYSQWGAIAKCEQLENKYPNLLKPIHITAYSTKTDTQTHSHYTTPESIDIQTIIKSSIAISEEIQMDSLLEKIMKIIIENAGAERGALLLLREDGFYIEAFLNEGINILKESILLEEANQIPLTVLNYVERTCNHIVMQEAYKDSRFNSDSYIKENKVKSILCSPILHKGELKGILYLENNLSTNVFTEKRTKVINILSSQAAISLENARLYQISREKENQYRTLMENINIGVYRNTGGAKGKFLQANQAIAKIFGYNTVDEFMKLHVSELYENPEERRKFLEVIQRNGNCKDVELKLKKKDGTLFYASCSATINYDENENMLWMDGIIEDITERKNTEIERKKFIEKLAELNANLEQKVEERTSDLFRAKTEIEEINYFVNLINSQVSLKHIFIEISKYIYSVYEIDGVGLFLPDEKKEYLYTFKAYCYKKISQEKYNYLMNLKIPMADSLGGLFYKTYKRKKSLYLPKISKYPFGIDKDILDTISICSLLYIPLIRKGESIGILVFSNVESKMLLSKKEIIKLTNLCSQIAGAIDTHYLLQQINEAKMQAEVKKEIALTAQKEAEKERQKSEKLLLNILPKKIAEELKEKGYTAPVLFESVSVMFTDFKGFTTIAEKLSPEELIKDLDACFTQFDKITERYKLEKLKTIGDSYMCAGGIPSINKTHAIDCVLAALEIQSFMNMIKSLKEEMGFPYWEIRLGIHSGPLVAGVIGEKKFAYDVWGDTVNTASRMESSGTPGRINISGATYQLVKDFFDCEYRGQINAKNKGMVDMYYVNGLKLEYSKDNDGKIPNGKFWKLVELL